MKFMNFATNVYAVNVPNPTCLFCSDQHSLSNCAQFDKQQHNEKICFVKEKRLCFKCLDYGHFSKQCKKHATCEKCKLNHPTVLHATVKMDKSVSTDTHELNSTVRSSFTTVKPLKDQTGAGESVKFSVLLVNVK